MAFQEVRIQQSVVEFILNHTEQIFSSDSVQIKPKEGMTKKSKSKKTILWEICWVKGFANSSLKKRTYFSSPGPSLMCGEKYATLPISGQCGPMKLMSLEEAQARSLSPNHPVHRERQRENSLPDTSTATLYHTVIDISDSKYDRFGFSSLSHYEYNLQTVFDACMITVLMFLLSEQAVGKLWAQSSVFIC